MVSNVLAGALWNSVSDLLALRKQRCFVSDTVECSSARKLRVP